MTTAEFEKIFAARCERSSRVLCAKNVDYARGGDKLHNFKQAAEMDGVTPEQAAKGMLLKHWQSLRDLLDDMDRSIYLPLAVWQEKLDDAGNYLTLIEALVHERYNCAPRNR